MQSEMLIQARDAAVEAARKAAHVIRFHAGRIDPERIRDKGIHDLVTEADYESQRVIVEHLKGAFPEFSFLAEEGDLSQGRPDRTDGYRWIIDPIDGTTNFTRGLPPYAVSIGLQHGVDIVAGVVYDVSRDDLFTAVKGGGSYRNGRRIRVSGVERLQESVVTTGFPYRSFGYVDEYLVVLKQFMRETHGLRRPGSAAVDLAYVAAGMFDGFFEVGLQPWDVAAGYVLVKEAGGAITDFAGNDRALFGKQVIASNGLLQNQMLEVAEPLKDVAV